MLALEAENDSEEEFDRICNLAKNGVCIHYPLIYILIDNQ